MKWGLLDSCIPCSECSHGWDYSHSVVSMFHKPFGVQHKHTVMCSTCASCTEGFPFIVLAMLRSYNEGDCWLCLFYPTLFSPPCPVFYHCLPHMCLKIRCSPLPSPYRWDVQMVTHWEVLSRRVILIIRIFPGGFCLPVGIMHFCECSYVSSWKETSITLGSGRAQELLLFCFDMKG